MPKIRCFVAIDLPEEILTILDSLIIRCKKNLSTVVRWTKKENIHLTLKFLGDVEPMKINPIEQAIQTITDLFMPFTIKVIDFGVFPNWKRPRIIWAGIQPSSQLQTLVHRLEEKMKSLDFIPEFRAFSPHLTIGRVKENISFSEVEIIENEINEFPKMNEGFMVDQIKLYQSDLQPSGPSYTMLYAFPLGIRN